MPWSFPGIQYPCEMVYTQHAGFDADKVQLRALPQASNFPTSGTLTMTWGAQTITLPNCVVDVASFKLAEGKFLDIMLLDRRDHWTRLPTVSGSYNLLMGGQRVPATEKNLRQIASLLFTAMGESADVSALPTNVYPRVTFEHASPAMHLRKLLEDFGFTITLGFGSEQIKVVKIGEGASLPTTDAFLRTEGLDPKVAPRYVRTVFGKTCMQARLALEAVGLDTDGTWKLINNLSYAPAGGWGSTTPYSMQDEDNLIAVNVREKAGFVRRAYRIKGFVNDTAQAPTWNVPFLGGTIPGLDYILPLEAGLLEKQTVRDWDTRGWPRVYGKRTRRLSFNDPTFAAGEDLQDTAVTDEVMDFFRTEREHGLVIFSEPQFIWNAGSNYYEPAQLYLECAFQLRNPTTYAMHQTVVDVDAYPQGSGYATVPGDSRLEIINTYSGNHAISGQTTNQASLQTTADNNAAAAAGLYSTGAAQQIVYSQPQLTLRCDGAIMQVQHVLTCGEFDHALNRTVASRNWEFDRGIPSRRERRTIAQAEFAVRDLSQARLETVDG